MSDIREDWAGQVIGQALNPDRFAGNQCVDTVDHFGEYIFGVPWQQCVGGVVGAKQLLDAAPDDYWERIDYYHGFVPQRFDVLVYAGDSLNQWGHTAVTESADNLGINVIQQDGFAVPHQFVDGNWYSAKPAHRARLAYSARGTGPLLGVLRPKPAKLRSSINPQGTITPTSEEDEYMPNQEWFDNLIGAVDKINNRVDMLPNTPEYWANLNGAVDNIHNRTADIGNTVWKHQIDWRNPATGELVVDATTPETVLSYVDANTARIIDAKSVAASIPDDIAQEVLDLLAARIGGK